MRIILALGDLHGFTQFCLIQVDWLQKTSVLVTLLVNHFLQFPFSTLSLPSTLVTCFFFLFSFYLSCSFFLSFPLSFVRCSFLLSFLPSISSRFFLLFLSMLLFFLSSSIFPICFPHLLLWIIAHTTHSNRLPTSEP